MKRLIYPFCLIALLLINGVASAGGVVIDELEPVEVNGTRQWVFSRSYDISKPVALFVHGGPGSPLMPFSRAFDEIFLNDFVVVHWDQRGSGKSYDPSTPKEALTLQQIVADGDVIVNHLKHKFNRQQIIIVGHSWGTIVASHMVKANPQNFYAYVSVGTVANVLEADHLKYNFLKTKITPQNDAISFSGLMSLGQPPYFTFEQTMMLFGLLWKYGGSFHKLTYEDIMAANQKSTEYNIEDIKNQSVAMKVINEQLSGFLNSYDAAEAMPSIHVPVFFVHGQHDMATPFDLSKKYIDKVVATAGKTFVLFRDSAHFPMYEEPSKFLEVLKHANQDHN